MEIPESLLELHKKCLGGRTTSYALKMKYHMSKEDKEWLESVHLTPTKLKWLILHDAKEIPVCPTCGKEVAFEKGRIYCSNKCRSADPSVLKKAEATNLERYGTKSAIQSEQIKDKVKKSNLEKYGTEWPFGSEEVRQKIHDTWMEKYETEYPIQNEEIKIRRRNTCMKNLGVPSPLHSKEVWDKIKATNLKNHGVEYIINDPEFRAKMDQKCEEKYGCKCSLMNEYVRQKAKETMMARYGAECSFKSPELQEKAKETMMARYEADNPAKKESSLYNAVIEARQKGVRKKNYIVNSTSLAKKMIEITTSESEYPYLESISYKCLRCGTEFESSFRNSQVVRCPSCVKKKWSKKEKDAAEWIRANTSENIIENDKSVLGGKELDIYIPSLHLAVEFNGTYWHSAELKPKNYHLEKTLACIEKKVRLIHIFEWEWDQNETLIKSLLLKALGVNQKTIYARQCAVAPLSQSDYKAFLSLHHLQGPVNSSIRLGLIYENKPVMVAGWGRSRFNSKEMELHRLCTKEGLNVTGGFSKLIAHSKLDYFISYVDRAHFTGDGYRKCGFVEIGSTPPGYRWVDEDGNAISRQMAQKSKLPKLLGEGYDPEMTEVQNMVENGWHQVFDCGNLKMEWTKK